MTASTTVEGAAIAVAHDDTALARATIRRVSLRLLPFLFVLYVFNFLDRTNVSIAALQMNRDLRFSAAAFGLGSGIFFVGYCLIPSFDHGWLAINIWHNAQYVLFVWLFNRNRFRGGVRRDARLLSWSVQPGRAWAYFGLCIALSTVVYLSLSSATAHFAAATALPASLILFQTINFHHYIVDALIWKVRQPKIRKYLSLAD